MKSIIIWTLCLITWLGAIMSCRDLGPPILESQVNKSEFVNLDSIINLQVEKLAGNKLKKIVSLNGETEQILIIADSALLMTDLSEFLDIDISKPSFNGEYDVFKKKEEKVFERKGNKGPQRVKLATRNNKILAIEGHHSVSNMLYSSARNFLLRFDQTSGGLVNYQFSGHQKILFKDTVFFAIQGQFEGD